MVDLISSRNSLVAKLAMSTLTQRPPEGLNWPVRDQRPTSSRYAGKETHPSVPGGFWGRLEALKASAERQLAQRPVVTIAAGLALGVVIGWLLKRR